MKIVALVAFLATLTLHSEAQLPGVKSSLSFEVRTLASGGVSNSNPMATPPTFTGIRDLRVSRTRTMKSQTTIELKVRNLGAQPASGIFEYYFVAQTGDKPAPYFWDKGTRSMTLEPGKEQTQIFQSAELAHSTVQSVVSTPVPGSSSQAIIYARTDKVGSRPLGWVVRLVVDGKVAQIRASSSECERLAKDLFTSSLNAPKPAWSLDIAPQ
jgi:hypothetical protein